MSHKMLPREDYPNGVPTDETWMARLVSSVIPLVEFLVRQTYLCLPKASTTTIPLVRLLWMSFGVSVAFAACPLESNADIGHNYPERVGLANREPSPLQRDHG